LGWRSPRVEKNFDGIDRPAIAGQIPNAKGHGTTVLDMGGHCDCNAEHLLQFAVMGAALVSALDNRENPTVGLLNIGEEAIKGNEVIKKAASIGERPQSGRDLNSTATLKETIFSKVRPGYRGVMALSEMSP
jgi:glycerol-3-phosphate acyltransferase PlsX